MPSLTCFVRCAPVVALALQVACGTEGRVIEPRRSVADEGARASAQYSDWSEPVNLGPIVNSTANDLAPELSKDGLSLYFASNRAGGFGANDIYVARRASVDEPFGAPQNLGAVINTTFGDAGPNLSRDGHLLYFTSGRPGNGGNDIYVSWRANTNDDFGWEAPVNLGPPVNTSESELGPNLRAPEFYFWRGPPTATSTPGDIYVSVMRGNEFGEPTLVTELSAPGAAHDEKPSIRFDGHEIFLASNRSGSLGLLDIWVSTRENNGNAGWSTPANLGPVINTAADDRRPALSADGTVLLFDSNRPGGQGLLDLYMSTRTKRGSAQQP